MLELLTLLPAISIPADSDSDSIPWLLAAGPAAGIAVYWWLFRFYRNTDKSHQFERETNIQGQPVGGDDQKVNEIRGTRERTVRGNNVQDFRQRVTRMDQ